MSENVKQNREFVAQLKQCFAQDLSRVIGEVDDLRQCAEILADDFYDRSTLEDFHKWLNCDHYWSERFSLSGCGSKENNDE